MKFTKTSIDGAYMIENQKNVDDRGHFSRSYCKTEFAKHGMDFNIVQENISHTKTRGTLRGLHYQNLPSSEAKLIRCLNGKVWDVILDLRPNSRTYLQQFETELSDFGAKAICVPPQVAHGFLTLTDNVLISYAVTDFYDPAIEAGIRYDDETFGIDWPVPIKSLSKKDKSWPIFKTQS